MKVLLLVLQSFFLKLVLVLAILFIGGIGIGIANTFFSIVNNPGNGNRLEGCTVLKFRFTMIRVRSLFLGQPGHPVYSYRARISTAYESIFTCETELQKNYRYLD